MKNQTHGFIFVVQDAGLTFLGARPGMGKSTFALQIASEIAAAGSPVLFYSLEMPSVRMEY